jgi:hypothetical protein
MGSARRRSPQPPTNRTVLVGVALLIGIVGSLLLAPTGDPYGQTHQAPQRRPSVAPMRVTNYGGFYGHDTKDVMQELNVRDAQQQQSFLANCG